MAQSLRQIKNRIRGTENTRKVTSAMQMISVAKLNRMDDVLFAHRFYAERLDGFLRSIIALGYDESSAVFLRPPKADCKIALCLFTSDTGLCGLYNNNIIRYAEQFIASRRSAGVELFIVGRRGLNYFSARNYKVSASFTGLNGRFSAESAAALTAKITEAFVEKRVDEVYLAYTHFESALLLKPVTERVLPFSHSEKVGRGSCIFESDPAELIKELIPRQLYARIRLAFLESFTSEHAARTVAMKAATDNAKDLLERLILMRNKVRQAGITQDIMEIISSAEALKG